MAKSRIPTTFDGLRKWVNRLVPEGCWVWIDLRTMDHYHEFRHSESMEWEITIHDRLEQHFSVKERSAQRVGASFASLVLPRLNKPQTAIEDQTTFDEDIEVSDMEVSDTHRALPNRQRRIAYEGA